MKKLIYLFLLLGQAAFAQEQLTAELLWKLGRVSNPQISPDGKHILYEVKRYDVFSNKGNNCIFVIPINSGTPIQATLNVQNAQDARWKPDGKKITFLSAENGSTQLYEADVNGANKIQVSNIEGGINGYKYSPDLKNIAYAADVKLDQTVSELYPDLPQVKARIMDGLMYRHWDSWHDYAYSHMFIAPYADGKISGAGIDIMKDERYDAPVQPFGGSEQFNWSPDGRRLAYTSRKQNGTQEAVSTNSDIYIYDLASLQTSDLTEANNGYDQNPAFSPDGKKIAWLSMRRAGNESDKNRLMVYYFDTKNMLDVTRDFDYTTESFEWNTQGNTLYFICDFEATQQIYFSSEVAGKSGFMFGTVKAITKGDHDYVALSVYTSADGKTKSIVGAKQNFSLPTELFSVDMKGMETPLTFTNKLMTDKITWGKTEKRWVTTTDGKKMLVWVILPPGMQPNKKYPTLLYCQGGPQSPVSQFFSYRWNFQLMANNGYVVVAPNRRGLPGFGSEWNDQISGDYGGQCMKDLLSAIDDVANEPYVNRDKMGAVGASFGGYSVYWLAGNHQKRFKTFIAHCGMFDMESWYGTTEEMWFANNDNKGPYWNTPRPKNFDASPHKFVQNWDVPILVIHNEKDYRVPLNQGMEAFTAAQLKGIKSRFLYFPDENHWVLKPQNAILWQRVFFDWLETYLK